MPPQAVFQRASRDWSWAWPLLFLALFIGQLSEEWSLNPQYVYGWGVPILGMLIFRQRWAARPEPAEMSARSAILAGLAAGLILWLPLRLLREANMDWRLLQWVIGAGAVAFILGGIYWMGGRTWLKHFAFTGLFLLLAVPWPTRLEQSVIQFSTEWVVRGAVEGLRWMGIAAWNAGNIIQLPNTTVGVDEACSGLRSLQGALMCALFLGEIMRLSRPRRGALVLLAVAIAVVLNCLRTFVLTAIAAQSGPEKASAWHDGTGIGTLVAAFLVLWALAWVLKQEWKRSSRGSGDEDIAATALPIRRIGAGVTIACAAWLGLVEVANAAWFRRQEHGSTGSIWTFDPAAVPNLRREAIPERTRAILRYNQGEAYRRSLLDGSEWWIYALAWDRDGGGSPLARFHSPEICLPAAGVKLVEEGRIIQPLGEAMAFRSYEFEWLEKPVYLFSSFVSSSGGAAATRLDQFDLNWRKRVEMALSGQRPAEQKVFQVMIAGARSRASAEEAFQEFARQTLRASE